MPSSEHNPVQNADYLIRKYGFLLFVIIFGIVMLYLMQDFIGGALGALVIYVIFKKWMINLVEVRKWNKTLASTLIMVTSFLVIVLPLFLLGYMVGLKVMEYTNSKEQIDAIINNLKMVMDRLPINLELGDIVSKMSEWAGNLVSSVFTNVVGAVTTITIMYFLVFFMLYNYGKMEDSLMKYIPFQKSTLTILGKELVAQTVSNTLGVTFVALGQGIVAFIVYMIAGLNDAGFLGVVTGLASIVPLVGTTIIWVPIVIYMISTGSYFNAVFITLSGIVILGNIDNVIRFVVSKKIADVHPVVTLLGVFFGIQAFGLLGVIWGPLLISFFLIFVRMYYFEYGGQGNDLKPTTISNLTNNRQEKSEEDKNSESSDVASQEH